MDKTALIIATITGTIGIAGGAILVDETAVTDVAIKQEEYRQKNGSYMQVAEGNKLPEGEIGTVIEKLGIDSPYRVDVYEAPEGKGYQIVTETPEGTVSFGFGPEAADRTYVKLKEVYPASSTKPK